MIKKFSVLAMLVFLTTAGFQNTARADEGWIYYESPTGVFRSHMREEHTSQISSLMIGDKSVVNSENIASKPQLSAITGNAPSYIVKFDQTIGPALSHTQISNIVLNEFKLYEDFYTNYKGVVNERDTSGTIGHYGGMLKISFEDPRKGPQSTWIRILVSNSTKLTQIAVGPPESMASSRTKKFFDDFQFFDGITLSKQKIRDTWKPLHSPLAIFTTYSPPEVTAPFFPSLPSVNNSEKAEVIAHVFYDPLLKESINFNVYGYVFPGVNEVTAKQFAVLNHINKLRPLSRKVLFEPVKDGNSPTLSEVTFEIAGATEGAKPRTVTLRIDYKDSRLLVMEAIGSESLVKSPFANTLFDLVTFSEAPPPSPTALKPEPDAAPAATTPPAAALTAVPSAAPAAP